MKDQCSFCTTTPDQPYEQIELSEFEISKYEITADQYLQCVGAGVCPVPDNLELDDPDALCSCDTVCEIFDRAD